MAGVAISMPSGLAHELRQDSDEQAGQAAHQRAVDADVLQVRTDVALELADELVLLPAHDLVLDEAPDLGAVLLDDERRAFENLLVEPGLDFAIGAQLVPDVTGVGGECRARERLVAQA